MNFLQWKVDVEKEENKTFRLSLFVKRKQTSQGDRESRPTIFKNH